MSYLDTKLNYYGNSVYETEPIGTCTLWQMLRAIKEPKPEILQLFKQIEEASKIGDKKTKDKLKSQLYYFSPCCFTDGLGRKYENIVSFTELLVLDFDNLDEDVAIDLKEFLFNEYSFIIASFLSSSKRGVKCLVRIPLVHSVEEFKAIFYGLAFEMQNYIGWDASSQNCILPNYLTYDYNLLMREDATVFSDLGYKEQEFPTADLKDTEDLDINLDHIPKIKRMIKNMIAQVDVEQTAHLKIRSTGLLIGAYVGSGYFEEEEITQYAFELMEDTVYLHKCMATYKRTLRDMIRVGITKPLTYNDER